MPKLRNRRKGDSNTGSIDREYKVLPRSKRYRDLKASDPSHLLGKDHNLLHHVPTQMIRHTRLLQIMRTRPFTQTISLTSIASDMYFDNMIVVHVLRTDIHL